MSPEEPITKGDRIRIVTVGDAGENTTVDAIINEGYSIGNEHTSVEVLARAETSE